MSRGKPKPIRVFYSELSRRFYATTAWKEIKPGVIEVTGEKFDVTNDIGYAAVKSNLEFTEDKGGVALEDVEADE
jgi:hypothetical protein